MWLPTATYECALFAKQFGVALNIAGGTHHAFADHGEGFCVFNDVAVASNLLLARGQATQILTSRFGRASRQQYSAFDGKWTPVFTFYAWRKNYPFRKQASDLDIDLPNETGDEAYLAILMDTLPALIAKVKPGYAVYQSAVDVLATDKLGKLALTRDGCAKRDAFVFSQTKAHGIPVAVVMGGGYSENIDDVVEAHCNTFRIAKGCMSEFKT